MANSLKVDRRGFIVKRGRIQYKLINSIEILHRANSSSLWERVCAGRPSFISSSEPNIGIAGLQVSSHHAPLPSIGRTQKNGRNGVSENQRWRYICASTLFDARRGALIFFNSTISAGRQRSVSVFGYHSRFPLTVRIEIVIPTIQRQVPSAQMD